MPRSMWGTPSWGTICLPRGLGVAGDDIEMVKETLLSVGVSAHRPQKDAWEQRCSALKRGAYSCRNVLIDPILSSQPPDHLKVCITRAKCLTLMPKVNKRRFIRVGWVCPRRQTVEKSEKRKGLRKQRSNFWMESSFVLRGEKSLPELPGGKV